MATKIWVNIGSGDDLLPDGTKPFPEPMLTHPHLRAFSQELPQPSITEDCLKINYLKFHSNLRGANELKAHDNGTSSIH